MHTPLFSLSFRFDVLLFFHSLVLTEIPRLEMPPPPPPMPPPITENLPQKIEDAPDAPSKIPVDDDRAGLMAAIR